MGIYLFRRVVFNCKRATFLAVKKQDGRASAWEQLQLFYHNLYCDACRRFIKQSGKIDLILADVNRHEYEFPAHQLPDGVKKDLQEQIDQHKK